MPPTADSFRYEGESNALVVACATLLVAGFAVAGLTAGVAVLILMGAIVYLKLRQGMLLGNSIVVNNTSFPRLSALLAKACERLGEPAPVLHVVQDPSLNAFALGIDSYSIVLHSATVQSMTDEELLFVVGHELGHIKCGHTRWLSLIAPLGSTIPGFDLVFGAWQRRAEYTCDRAGLLVTRDLESSIRALIKIVGGATAADHTRVDEILMQAARADESQSSVLGQFLLDHPYATHRIRELIAFYRSSTYDSLVRPESVVPASPLPPLENAAPVLEPALASPSAAVPHGTVGPRYAARPAADVVHSIYKFLMGLGVATAVVLVLMIGGVLYLASRPERELVAFRPVSESPEVQPPTIPLTSSIATGSDSAENQISPRHGWAEVLESQPGGKYLATAYLHIPIPQVRCEQFHVVNLLYSDHRLQVIGVDTNRGPVRLPNATGSVTDLNPKHLTEASAYLVPPHPLADADKAVQASFRVAAEDGYPVHLDGNDTRLDVVTKFTDFAGIVAAPGWTTETCARDYEQTYRPVQNSANPPGPPDQSDETAETPEFPVKWRNLHGSRPTNIRLEGDTLYEHYAFSFPQYGRSNAVEVSCVQHRNGSIWPGHCDYSLEYPSGCKWRLQRELTSVTSTRIEGRRQAMSSADCPEPEQRMEVFVLVPLAP